jgi:hypothetical protein
MKLETTFSQNHVAGKYFKWFAGKGKNLRAIQKAGRFFTMSF